MKSSRLEFMTTVIGFGMSIMFIIFLFIRLLCLRLNLIASTTPPDSSSRTGFGMLERGINGMEPIAVASFPTMKYNNQLLASTEDAICTVCLGEYQEKDLLRLLPSCGHAFHIDCIDVWLRKNSTCPVCRLSLRDTSYDKNILSPWLNTRLWSRYSSGTNDEYSYAILNRVQSRSPVNVQEQPRITLASEVDENRRDEHLVVEIALENPFCHVSGNGYGKQVLCSFQSNNVENECAQIISQAPDQNLIDKELQA